ncbi:MAG: haloacid dehalogenase type II [Pseudomonadota bacterium]
MTVKACVFDAYGTLFDVSAAARACAAEPGRAALAEVWPALAETWRAKQLNTTWLRAAADDHVDFWTVTRDALSYALEAHGLGGDAALEERLMQLYFELDAFPETPEVLRQLKAQGRATAILSNGEPKMLAAAASSAGVEDLLDDILSAESVGVFKPHARVYELVTKRFDCAPSEIVFVSSNCWDACFAARYGFHTFWVNRRGEPMERLSAQPQVVLSDLSDLPARVAATAG